MGNNSDNDEELQPQPQPQQKPRDGPATVFEADPMVSDIFACEDGDYFGLVLVTNWPASPLDDIDMDGPYQDFLRAVKSCFESEDITISKATTTTTATTATIATPVPAVYLYPTIHLHITLATFLPPTKVNNNFSTTTNEEEEEKLNLPEAKRIQDFATTVVRCASKLPDWPTQPLRLVVDRAQLGAKAGILLWKDLSGGVAAIRKCLQQVSSDLTTSTSTSTTDATTSTRHDENNSPLLRNGSNNTDSSSHFCPPAIIVPGIIHSTFLRFSRVPQTPGDKVQEQFQSKVLPRIGEFFNKKNKDVLDIDDAPTTTVANTVKLVCTSTPYMHVEDDEKHVVWRHELN